MTEVKNKRHRPMSDPGSNDHTRDGTEGHRTGDSPEDSCRCKEVSKKTFPDLLRLMISDLAFWKKNKGRT